MPELSREQAIVFHAEGVELDMPGGDLLADWLHQIASAHDSLIEELTYIICTDDYILQVNRDYLNHDYYTDIITFPYRQGASIHADVFVSIDRVKDNAIKYGDGNVERELLRVLSHGLLHLLGYGDKTEQESTTMRQQEDVAIDLFYSIMSRQ